MDSNLLVLLVFSFGVAIECKLHCDYTYYKDAGGWLKYHGEPTDFETARQKCSDEGALLASPSGNLTLRMNSIVSEKEVNGVLIKKKTVSKSDSSNNDNSNKKKQICQILNKNGKTEDVECNINYPYICYNNITNVQNECGTGYTLLPDSKSCVKLNSTQLTHDDSEDTCAQEGGHLLVINSEAEQEAIKAFLKSPSLDTSYTRVGFKKFKGNFITVNGKPLGEEGINFNSEATKEAIEAFLKSASSGTLYTIGIKKFDGNFITVNGKSLDEEGFNNWKSGEPNNVNGKEECGGIQRSSALLNDIQCNAKKYNFICEKNLQCVGFKPI